MGKDATYYRLMDADLKFRNDTSEEETKDFLVNRPFWNCLLSELPLHSVDKLVRLIAVHLLHFMLQVRQNSNPESCP